jgi:plasmid stability protein
MPSLTIRNLEEPLKKRLRIRAAILWSALEGQNRALAWHTGWRSPQPAAVL